MPVDVGENGRRRTGGGALTGRRILVACGVLALLAGCTAGPNFAPPESGLPQKPYAAPEARRTAPPDPNWWAVFHDKTLTGLEGQVAGANLDVLTATIRLAESRSTLDVTAAAQLPSLGGDAKVSHERYSQNGILSLMKSLLPPGQKMNVPAITDFYTGFDASWELDFWGKVRREVEAAGANVQFAKEQRRAALISAQAETARDYILLRDAQVQRGVAVDNLKIAQDVLRLANERRRKGLQSALDSENAAAQVEALRAQLPIWEQKTSQYINALSFLLGEPPGALRAKLAAPRRIPWSPPAVPVGLPSGLARRRPDIRAAEAKLHAATAQIGVAVAAFYPSVQLNGVVGLDSLDLPTLWRASSLQYNFGPSISLPIFNGGRLQGTVELRKAQQREAAINYRRTVLQAWHDVVNALVAHRTQQERRARLAAELAHARNALSIARARYRDGVVDFLSVLYAQRTALLAEQQLAQSKAKVALDLVQLFKALGGGWQETFPADATTTARVAK